MRVDLFLVPNQFSFSYWVKFRSSYNLDVPHGVIAKMLSYGLEVNDVEIQLRYDVNVWTHTLEKGISLLLVPSMA